MEIKINREIRNQSESVFFGLSLRQLIFSLLSIGIAIAVYFLLGSAFSLETRSWLCILCAGPFGAMGFISYNGMTADKLVICVLKSLSIPKMLLFQSKITYEHLTEEANHH